ncbi:hypothetical protein RV00_GL001559 [Enterococcus devriesei]|uniref:Uncharacterized protein n=1 Tax=Enterococcus devriesei TaxID=319970 RepID=A0A1L8SKE7_9ENTE|nr:hypothetical protein RV00_GL001559 [Enterococcus devriesei]
MKNVLKELINFIALKNLELSKKFQMERKQFGKVAVKSSLETQKQDVTLSVI